MFLRIISDHMILYGFAQEWGIYPSNMWIKETMMGMYNAIQRGISATRWYDCVWKCGIPTVLPFKYGANIIWFVVYLPLWKMMEFVSWDDYSIPNCFWKVIQNSMVPVTTNQSFFDMLGGYGGIGFNLGTHFDSRRSLETNHNALGSHSVTQ